jgi:DNA invertase Pin-like site-specific DNA recombinase
VTKTTPIVAYYRVSTARQGQSGLGLEAQRAAVAGHVANSGAPLVAEFTEIESGRKTNRRELTQALAQCRATGSVLVIAKLDRLARSVTFLSQLMEGDVKFRALDLPGATPFTLHILAAVAEQEATAISARTKAALQAAKARGTKLGMPTNLTELSRQRSLAVRQARAAERHRRLLPYVHGWTHDGLTVQQMTDKLTEDFPALRPGARVGQPLRAWTYVQALRLLDIARRVPSVPIAPPATAARARVSRDRPAAGSSDRAC